MICARAFSGRLPLRAVLCGGERTRAWNVAPNNLKVGCNFGLTAAADAVNPFSGLSIRL